MKRFALFVITVMAVWEGEEFLFFSECLSICDVAFYNLTGRPICNFYYCANGLWPSLERIFSFFKGSCIII